MFRENKVTESQLAPSKAGIQPSFRFLKGGSAVTAKLRFVFLTLLNSSIDGELCAATISVVESKSNECNLTVVCIAVITGWKFLRERVYAVLWQLKQGLTF